MLVAFPLVVRPARAALVMSLAVGCTPETPTSPGADTEERDTRDPVSVTAPEAPSIESLVVITIDTLRADRLVHMGHDRDTSPHIAELAAESQVFTRGVAQAFWTLPSVSSFFSGVHPRAHGCCHGVAGEHASEGLLEALDTLPEQLQGAGFQTAAVLKSAQIGQTAGFDQGFDSFEWVPGTENSESSAGELLDRARGRLDALRLDEPFFLYVHFMDPHVDYRAPDPWYGSWADDYDSTVRGDSATLTQLQDGTLAADEATVGRLLAFYDEEIAYVDEVVGSLLDDLTSAGVLETTAVLVMGDHGEQFDDHGDWSHKHVWEELLHVPFVLWLPGQEPATFDARVQTVDFTATLAEVMGVDPGDHWAGRSLSPLWTDGDLEEVEVLAGAGTAQALFGTDDLKLVRHEGAADALFDLASDPGEQVDLAADRPDELEAMSVRMASWLDELGELQELLRAE